MKINYIVNAAVATAGALFVVGAIAQKSPIKDLGLSVFIATGLIKQQQNNQKLSDFVSRKTLTGWQHKILTEVENLSHSVENTEQKLQKQIDLNADVKQWEQANKRISKLDQQIAAQEKQQNNMRSSLDQLKHQIKTEKKNARQSQSFKKNFDHLAEPTKITSQLIAQQPTTHVYIDGNNFKCAAYKLNLSVDYQALKSYLMPDNGKIRLNFYDGVCQASRFNQNQFHSHLNHLGYKVTSLPTRIHQDGTKKTIGDDVSIALDIAEQVKTGDRLILISGDGDYFPVIQRIQQRQVKVLAIASATSMSDLTLSKVDEFVNLDDIKKLIARVDNAEAA
jgi:uncharacterized LabA/DUF88 family protein